MIRKIPHSLLPSRLPVFNVSHSYTSIVHIVEHYSISDSITTRIITYIYITIALMVDNTRLGLCRTDECQTGSELHTRKHHFN